MHDTPEQQQQLLIYVYGVWEKEKDFCVLRVGDQGHPIKPKIGVWAWLILSRLLINIGDGYKA